MCTVQNVAFVGLGAMGTPIGRHIHDSSDFRFVGFDASDDVRRELRESGMTMADSLVDAVKGADWVMMMLPTVAASRAVFEDVIARVPAGTGIIELGTIGHTESAEHANIALSRGLRYLDAPVIGGGRQAAEARTLKVLAGGEASTVAEAECLLRCFSARTFHVGGEGAGQTVKLVHNALLASITGATAEAFALAQALGTDPAAAAEIFRSSSANSFALEWLFLPALKGDFSAGAPVDILLKDLRLMAAEAERVGQPLSIGRETRELYEECHRRGYGRDDAVSVALKITQDRLGLVDQTGGGAPVRS
ncbi:NAD(P)-dependent oxidoreductase [Pseudonocardia sp. RS010]|uniref:NAD(P)-dependent oxidoreductase n=1 Tax=Pseudonocardia sp. RS010 TaxID=3385979 RepID=UPI00399F6C93